MASQGGQRLHARLRLAGTLIAMDPLHVGGEGLDPDTDMPLARNGQGQLYIPGSSLTGAIRDAAPMDEADELALWGALRRASKDKPASASRVWIADAVLADTVLPELRDGVGIDRRTGTAADGIKFDRMVLPPGTAIGLEIMVELRAPEEEERAVRLLGAIVAAAAREALRLGAAQTRGLGRLSLRRWTVHRRILDSRVSVLELLRTDGRSGGTDITSVVEAAAKAAPASRRGWQAIIRWTADSPMMVKAAGEGRDIKMLPLTTADRDGGGRRLVLPGSGIKGALRSQAERISRTLRGNDAPAGRFQDQLEGCELPVMLFGIGGPPKGLDRGQWRPGRGAVGVADCVATEAISAAKLQELASGSSQQWLKESRDASDAPGGLDVAYHVAVDRWTGGAAEGLLFQAVEPRVTWEPIRLDIAFERLPVEDRAAALSLLLMVLRDLAEGWVTLGFGGNRGYGEVRVERIEIEGDDPRGGPPAQASRMTWTRVGGWGATDASLGTWLEEGWRAWRGASIAEAKA